MMSKTPEIVSTYLIPEIRPMLERLLETNFRISSRIVAEVLKMTGEEYS